MIKQILAPLRGVAIAAVMALGVAACSSNGMNAQPQASLYDRLGGKEALSAVVNHLWGVVAADERINGRFANTQPAAFAGQLVDFLCQGTGGPCQYQGKNMHDAHTGMNLSSAEFMALGDDVVQTLNHFKVPAAEQKEVMDLLISMQGDVIDH